MSRIVISGFGVASRLGIGEEKFIKNISSDDNIFYSLEELKSELDEKKNKWFAKYDLSNWRLMDYLSRLAVIASLMAYEDAGLEENTHQLGDQGVFFGTEFGCLESNVKFNQKLLQSSPRFVSRTTFTNTVSNAAVGQICLALKIKGIHATCASGGLYPLIYGIQQLNADRIRMALVGGMEKIAPLALQGLAQLQGWLNQKVEENGIYKVVEGAGTFVLSKAAHCNPEKIRAEVLSYGVGADFKSSMSEALKRGNCSSQEVELLISNGNGSKWDPMEGQDVRDVFTQNRPVTIPIKKRIGEAFGVGPIYSIGYALSKLSDYKTIMINSASFDLRSKGTIILRKY